MYTWNFESIYLPDCILMKYRFADVHYKDFIISYISSAGMTVLFENKTTINLSPIKNLLFV